MILTIDFDAIIAHAISTGANREDYSSQFWEAFDALYPEVTNKYARALEPTDEVQE